MSALPFSGVDRYRLPDRLAPHVALRLNGAPAHALMQHVSSVEIVEALAEANVFTIQLQDVVELEGPRWLDHPSCQPGSTVQVQLGYLDQQRLMLDGYLQSVSASFSDGLGPALTLSGTDGALQALSIPTRAQFFREGTPDSEVVATLARMVGLQADVDPTQGSARRRKSAGITLFDYFRTLATLHGFHCYLAGRTVYFKRPGSLVRQPRPVLQWGRNLLSLSSEMSLSRTVSSVTVQALDRSNREPVRVTARAGSERRVDPSRPQTASQLSERSYGPIEQVISDHPVDSVDEAEQLARSQLEEAGRNLITASCTVIGDPSWRPGTEVEITGVGRSWLSGVYCVRQVTHTINQEGYRTALQLERNSV